MRDPRLSRNRQPAPFIASPMPSSSAQATGLNEVVDEISSDCNRRSGCHGRSSESRPEDGEEKRKHSSPSSERSLSAASYGNLDLDLISQIQK